MLASTPAPRRACPLSAVALLAAVTLVTSLAACNDVVSPDSRGPFRPNGPFVRATEDSVLVFDQCVSYDPNDPTDPSAQGLPRLCEVGDGPAPIVVGGDLPRTQWRLCSCMDAQSR